MPVGQKAYIVVRYRKNGTTALECDRLMNPTYSVTSKEYPAGALVFGAAAGVFVVTPMKIGSVTYTPFKSGLRQQGLADDSRPELLEPADHFLPS